MTQRGDRRRPRRGFDVLVGGLLVTFGLAGLVVSSVGRADAAERERAPGSAHDAMHRMMEAVHGTGAVARMHQTAGGEDMMETCASMMDDGTMDDGTMDDGMMDDGMMDDGMMDDGP